MTFLHGFAPGGVERIAARLHHAWTAAGIDAEIVVADATTNPPMPLANIRQVAPTAKSGRIARALALATGLPALVRARRPDVLFCAGNTYTAVAVIVRLVLGTACPPIVAKISNCLVRPDMSPPMRFFYGIWLRIQGRYIDHFVGMAPAMRSEIAQLLRVPQHRITIIADPALCAADRIRLAAARDSVVRNRPGRHYLAVGRLAPQKNFAVLLDAFAQIARTQDTLTILGDGAERAALLRLAGKLGIADAVFLPGHVDPLDQWLAHADAFVLSSDYEGVPAVLIEALAAGLPIIATDCCVSMGDLLGHGALGTIVRTGDVTALGAAMNAIGPEPAGLVASRRTAAAAFTIEQAAGDYLATMHALVDARAAVTAPRTQQAA